MRIQSRIKVVILAAMLGAPGFSWADTTPALDQGRALYQVPALRPMNDTERQSVGCITSAAATMAATYAAGPSEMIMLVVGGLVAPSSSPMLFTTLMATMASLGCVGGASVTPLVTWLWSQATKAPPGAAPPAQQIPASDQLKPSDSDYVFESGMGCLVTGGGSLVTASVIGATETLMIAAGGLLVPSSPPTLWLGLFSTLFAGTCTLGAGATPGLLWAYDQKESIGGAAAAPLGALLAAAKGPAESGPQPSKTALASGVQ